MQKAVRNVSGLGKLCVNQLHPGQTNPPWLRVLQLAHFVFLMKLCG